MAIQPCAPCVTQALDDSLDRATTRIKEKDPKQLAAEGKAQQAEHVAKAMIKRAGYTVDKLEALDETSFAQKMDTLDEHGGGGAPPMGGSLPPEFTIPKRLTPATLLNSQELKIKGWFARFVPMREVWGKPVQERVWTSFEQSQETMMRIGAKVMKTHMDHGIVPGRWYSAARPNMRMADEDSMKQVFSYALAHRFPPGYNPWGVSPTRKLRPNEIKAALELEPMIWALLKQTNAGPARFLKNYIAHRPHETMAFMSTLTRQAVMDKLMKPTLSEIEKGIGLMKGSSHPMMSLWNEWKGYLLGRPTPNERQLSITLNRVGSTLAKLPGPVGRAFAGRENPRAALAFTEIVTSWFYSGAMGLRPSSALRNLLDTNQTLAELGGYWTARGIAKMGKEGFEEANKAGVLTSAAEALTMEEQQLLGGSLSSTISHYALVMFRKVDMANRAAGYYGAKAKFQHYLASGKIHRLIDGKGLVTGMRKDIRASVRHMLKNDMVDEAMEMYARDVVANTQYLYGRGNTPISMQSSVGKMVGMFSQWPLNYVQLMKSFTEDGRRSAAMTHIASTMALIYGAGEVFDINMADWLGAGSMPGEVGISGPGPKLALFGTNAVLSATKIAQAELFGGRHAVDKTIEFEKRQMNESLRQLQNSVYGVAYPGAGAVRDIGKSIAAGSIRPMMFPTSEFNTKDKRAGIRQPRKPRNASNRSFIEEGLLD